MEEEEPSPDNNRSVKKRAVCYIPGYDPRGPKMAHRTFKRESAKQAEVSDYRLEVGKHSVINDRVSQWSVKHTSSHEKMTETDFFHLNYDNLIKANWEKTTPQVYRSILQGFWTFFSNGFFMKGKRMGWPTFLAMNIPMLLLLIQLSIIIVSSWLLFCVSPWHWGINVAVLALVGIVVYRLEAYVEKQFNYRWMVRTYRFFHYRKSPELPAIMKAHSAQLLSLVKSDEYQEIIVVGHSMGTILAAELIDQIRQADDDFARRKAEINMITVGTMIGLVAGVKGNEHLQNALHRLKNAEDIDWLEFSAKVDGANVFLKHPLFLTKGWNESPRLPRLLPARFFKCYSPEGYKKLRNDRLRLHFQYVFATEKAGEYDYFQMITGTNFLRDSFPESDNS